MGNKNSDLIITIMAGGMGKRMNSNLPKVLHKIDNIPLIIHIIKISLLLNPYKIAIIVGKFKNEICSEISNYINNNVINDKIEFFIQKEPLGTGDAIKSCLSLYNNNLNSNVLILSGDVPLISYETLSMFIENKYCVKILINEFENPLGYGRIITQNNIFCKIIEEKDCTNEEKKIKLINSGIYFFNSSFLTKYLPFIHNNNSQKEYYLTDIFEIIKNNENINIELFLLNKEKNYEIMGVNTKEQLKQLENIYKKINN